MQRTLLAVAVPTVALAVLTGCGSSSSSGVPSSSSSSSAPDTPSSSAASVSSGSGTGSGGGDGACAAVGKDSVGTALSTMTVPDGKNQHAVTGNLDTCSFGGVGGTGTMTVNGVGAGLTVAVNHISGTDEFDTLYFGGSAGFANADKVDGLGAQGYAKIMPASLGTGDAIRVTVLYSSNTVLDIRLSSDDPSDYAKLATQQYEDALVGLARIVQVS